MSFTHGSIRKARKYAFGLSLFAIGLSFGPIASAADADAATYKQERAACMDGSSHQDRATCLKEVGAARGEARRGHLTDSSSYESNAMMRCNALPPADRQDCARRVHGEGVTSGSVGGGGIYRETTTTVIEPQPQSAPVPVAPAPVYRPVPVAPPGTMTR